ncbi:PREDICTED: uncharacterized protein LOC106897844 isoform X2 [Calidris pugnax]|uniref:uncharacterized protein LOC106897844 isoform X2 n=1 Tax=Calidris pugnax TaxID=198806 RepID=UPI00071DE8C0|nr:PREDICTED: uncharacterized protein LOC106897844 isoform X2 [Calidris pugnax]
MAFVPDLDTLECGSLNEETFYGPDCLCLQKKPRLDSGVTLPGVGIQVTVTKGHPARTFRQAAILVVAVTKLLKRPVHKDFADSDLGGFLDEIFGMGWWCWGWHPNQGTLLRDALGPRCISIPLTIPSPQSPSPSSGSAAAPLGHLSTATPAPSPLTSLTSTRSASCWSHPPSWWPCTCRDPLPGGKVRGHSSDPMSPSPTLGPPRSHPTALGLPVNPSLLSAVKLNIALYRPRSSKGGLGTGQVPVALGIKGYQLYMSCVMSGAKPVLQLEEVDVRRDIESVELTRFIFYRLDSPAEGTTRFESAAFPGWFICTSLQPRQPVGITNHPDQVNIATYELSRR